MNGQREEKVKRERYIVVNWDIEIEIKVKEIGNKER